MTSESTSYHGRFAEFKAGGKLPSPSGVALELMKLSSDENVSLGKISDTVKLDPALSSRLVKMSNSSVFGGRRPVVAIGDAVSRLGMRAVSQMVLSFSLVSKSKEGVCLNFDYKDYWKKSLFRALFMQKLGRMKRISGIPEEFFSLGLLSEIGHLGLATIFPAEYSEMLNGSIQQSALRKAEVNRFGMTGKDLTISMFEDWGLPKVFSDAVYLSDLDEGVLASSDDRKSKVSLGLRFSDFLSRLTIGKGKMRQDEVMRTQESTKTCGRHLGFQEAEMQEVINAVSNEWKEFAPLLEIEAEGVEPEQVFVSTPSILGPSVRFPSRTISVLSIGVPATTVAKILSEMDVRAEIDTATSVQQAKLLMSKASRDLLLLSDAQQLSELAQNKNEFSRTCFMLISDSWEAVKDGYLSAADIVLGTGFENQDMLLAALTSAMLRISEKDESVLDKERLRKYALELETSNRKISQAALTDRLTGLPNRLLFSDRLERDMSEASRSGQLVSVFMLDMDKFASINDMYGHAIGDEILLTVSERLKSVFPEFATIARFGNDEFAICLQTSNKETSISLSSRLTDVLSSPFVCGSRSIRMTGSIGVSFFPADGATQDELIRNAEVAMHVGKKDGNKGLSIYSKEMSSVVLERLGLENALSKAVDNNELELHYQPIFLLDSRRVLGVEALLRWNRPGMGLWNPERFIPVAEETGLIHQIGDWVIRESVRQAKIWQVLTNAFKISVNVSPKQFQNRDLPSFIDKCIRDEGIRPSSFGVEITESAMMSDVHYSIGMLEELSALGVSVALDDFGTGYSSLSYLKKFNISSLKIDKSFILDIPKDKDDMAITKMILSLASTLGLDVTAEGIETKEQLAFLVANGCRTGQGFLMCKPMPAGVLSQAFFKKK